MTRSPRPDPARAQAPSTGWVRRGDFASAWEASEEVLRWRAGQTPEHLTRHCQWVWNGQPVGTKRALIRC